MSYRAFYREWRPQRFADVVGQEHIVRTLQNALKAGQIGHAYLFSGPRGTGKTSVAKILAKTVNCLNGPDIEPCNRCDNCLSITAGSFVDVLEIDAASNRGIDEIRDLKEKVRYLPAEGKKKVYIIDEVHMLTTEAFNALLKTLEEPPEHVIFLLATTEPHKLPATILSRCQRFDFRRLSIKEISSRLREVADFHQINTNEGALVLIARHAEGAMRDALGLLEQAASFGNKTITEKEVISILGIIDDDIAFRMADALLSEDHRSIIELVNEVINNGKDPKELVHALVLHFRNLLVVKSMDHPGDLVSLSEEGIEKIRKQSSGFDEEKILQILDFLARTENDLRWSILPRIAVETALIRVTGLGPSQKDAQITDRLRALEREIAILKENRYRQTWGNPDGKLQIQEKGDIQPAAKEFRYDPVTSIDEEHADEEIMPMEMEDPGEDVLTYATIKALWPQVLNKAKNKSRTIYSYLAEGQPIRYENSHLVIGFSFDIHKEQIEKRENRLVVEEILKEQYKEKIHISCETIQQKRPSSGPKTDRLHDPEVQGMDSGEIADHDVDLFGGKIVDISN